MGVCHKYVIILYLGDDDMVGTLECCHPRSPLHWAKRHHELPSSPGTAERYNLKQAGETLGKPFS